MAVLMPQTQLRDNASRVLAASRNETLQYLLQVKDAQYSKMKKLFYLALTTSNEKPVQLGLHLLKVSIYQSRLYCCNAANAATTKSCISEN